MSANGDSPSEKPPASYSAGLIAMLIFGIILLLPGVCALVFIAGTIWDMVTNDRGFDPFIQVVVFVWAVSFAITAVGVVLIVKARRRARVPR